MKSSLLAFIFASTLSLAMACTFVQASERRNGFIHDCALVEGLVIAADVLKEPTARPVYLWVDGWIAIAELDTAKAFRLETGFAHASKLAKTHALREGLKPISTFLESVISQDYGAGDGAFWGKVVDIQQGQYATVLKSLINLKMTICGSEAQL